MSEGLGSNISSVVDGKPVKVQRVTKPRMTRIILEENDAIPPTGLPIGHNGDNYILQPGMEVEVPPGVLSVLNDAVMSVATIDPQTRQVVGYRDRMKYPYRRVQDRTAA